MKSVIKLISTELFSKFVIMIVVSSSFNARFLTTFTLVSLSLFFLHFLSATSLFGIVNIDCNKNTIIKLSIFFNWAFEKKETTIKKTYIDYAVQSSLPYCLEQSAMVLTEIGKKIIIWKCFEIITRKCFHLLCVELHLHIGIVLFLVNYLLIFLIVNKFLFRRFGGFDIFDFSFNTKIHLWYTVQHLIG